MDGKRKKSSKTTKHREFNFRRYPKRRIAILFLYFGWEHDGLVCQQSIPNTVEGHLNAALLKTKLIESWKTCQYSRSGRTDKGVSAFRQVASLIVRSNDPNGEFVFWPEDTDSDRISGSNSEMNFVKILNATLPKSIRILGWAPVPLNFSARFNCTQRVYKYVFPVAAYDLEAMKIACNNLAGEHDFRNFCHIDRNSSRLNMSYTRTIHSAEISVVADGDGSRSNVRADFSVYRFAELTIRASGFLWHQIRCVVSLLHEIGKQREDPKIICDLLNVEKYPRRPAYGLSPATPLYFFDCSFEGVDISWVWEVSSLRNIKEFLLKTYAEYRVRCLMLKNMIEEIGASVPELNNAYEGLDNFLTPTGESSCAYIPLRKRKTCDSLEEKREKTKNRKIADNLAI